jgi:hypothetical protein
MNVEHEKGKILSMTLVHLASANLFVLASAKEFVALRKKVRPSES